MAKKDKKGFRAGAYAVAASIILAVVLVVLSIFTVATKYTAFSPEKLAQSYVDGIVQTGDGYNAYKVTLLSKNMKYGEFIKAAYMRPYVNDGDDVKQAEFVGTGSTKEQEAIDSVYNTMYDYYCELLKTNGYDDYDAVFDNYFKKLVEVRHNVYGDDYMSEDYMFGAFEANVQTYANSLTGTKRVFASDNKTILTEESIGTYQIMFGNMEKVEVEALVDGKKQTVTEEQPVYKLTTEITSCEELSADETKAYVEEYSARIKPVAQSGEAKADSFGLKDEEKEKMVNAYAGLDCTEDIKSVAKVSAQVKTQNGDVVATQELYVVKIGKSWYVDNTNIDTSALYISQGE
jgi:polyhydroxyalkanoate synthesis regulator phasin